MFKVQRFTAEDEEEEAGSGRAGDSTSILNKVLERAKARASAKRACLASSSDDVQHQPATIAPQLERKPGTKVLSSGAGGSEGADVSRGGQSLTAAGNSKDRAGYAAQEEVRSASENDEESSEEEESSSGESGSEEESGDDDEEEKDAEILPTAGPAVAEPQGSSAAEGGGEEQEPEGQELRPMEEVAEEWGLDSRLAETLREEGVKHFFPIQVRYRYVPPLQMPAQAVATY